MIGARCIEGQAEAVNKRITDAFDTTDTEFNTEGGDEGGNACASASSNTRSEKRSRAGHMADENLGQGAVCVDAARPDLAPYSPYIPIRRVRFGSTFAAESSVHFPGSGCCPGSSRGRAAGEGRCAMAGVAVRESMTFAARPDQVREARAFVGRLLGPSHPCGDAAVLLASEVVTNSLLHVGSAGPGEAVTVTVVVGDAGVRVEVTGRKADGVPVLRGPDDEAEGSRGLRLVEELAVRWGYERGGGMATTWFECEPG